MCYMIHVVVHQATLILLLNYMYVENVLYAYYTSSGFSILFSIPNSPNNLFSVL